MAKPAKKKTHSSGTLQPMAVLFNLDKGTERGDAVRAVLAEQGLRVKTVAPEHLGDPVGSLAGLVGFRPARAPYEGEVPDCEFMLLCHVPNAKMQSLLAAMRAADATVGCKAQLTQHNRLWPFATLVAEVSKEHAAMTAASQ